MDGDSVTFEQSADIADLAAAISKAQAEIGTVPNGREVKAGKYEFTYAKLSSVWETLRPILGKHDLAVIQSPARVGGRVEVTTQIIHASGQWIRGRMSMPSPDGPQDIGKVITYAKRYALSAMLGVATDDMSDDDGASMQRKMDRDNARKTPAVKTNRPDAVEAFRSVGVLPRHLETYLGHSLENITDEEAAELRSYWTAIRAGNEEAREELCGPSPAKRMEEELSA